MYAPGPAGAPGGPAGPAGPAAHLPTVSGIHPMIGSICGGTKLTVFGTGFSLVPTENAVFIAGNPCTVTMATEIEIMCSTPPAAQKLQTEMDVHVAALSVTVRGAEIPVSLDLVFRYTAQATPILSTFGPVSGQGGDLVSFEGANFGTGVSITIGDKPCEVKRVSDLFVQCTPQPACAGLADVHLYAEGLGNACPGPKTPPLKFLYSLSVQSVRPEQLTLPSMGSFGGGGSLIVVGQGFCESDTVTLCETSVCTKTTPVVEDPARFHEGDPSFQTFKCRPSRLSDPQSAKLMMTPCDGVKMSTMTPPEDYNKTCQLTVSAAVGALKASIGEAWTYSHRMTPEISKVGRGASGAGHLEIWGSGFKPGPDFPLVQVGGVPCEIATVTSSKIDCHDATSPPEGAIVTVSVPGFGEAVPTAAGVELVPKLLAAPVSLALGLPKPVPTTIPSKSAAIKNNAATRCRREHQLTDCPGGWKCCHNDGDSGVKPLPALPGICAPVCLSLLQRSK